MFSDEKRQFTVFSDWDNLVYMDSECKIILPLQTSALFNALPKLTTADDKKVTDASAVFSKKVDVLARLLYDSGKFRKKHQNKS